jgi:hypothetical protein
MSTCLGDMANITVELPKSLYDRPETNQTPYSVDSTPCLEPAVPSLLLLHLTELTITKYEDKREPLGDYKFWVSDRFERNRPDRLAVTLRKVVPRHPSRTQ